MTNTKSVTIETYVQGWLWQGREFPNSDHRHVACRLQRRRQSRGGRCHDREWPEYRGTQTVPHTRSKGRECGRASDCDQGDQKECAKVSGHTRSSQPATEYEVAQSGLPHVISSVDMIEFAWFRGKRLERVYNRIMATMVGSCLRNTFEGKYN